MGFSSPGVCPGILAGASCRRHASNLQDRRFAMIRKIECPVRETLWHVKLRNEVGETLYHWPTFIVAADTPEQAVAKVGTPWTMSPLLRKPWILSCAEFGA
jgi:hypothetical protein